MGWEIWVLGGCWKGWGIWVSGRLLEEVRYLGVGEAAGGVGKSRGGGGWKWDDEAQHVEHRVFYQEPGGGAV